MTKQKSLYRKGLSGGKKFGPPPKKGPTSQGLNISYNTIKIINLEKKTNGRHR